MAWEAAMDRFVNRQNIERYRRLAVETTNATERLQIMNLLAEEEAKFKLLGIKYQVQRLKKSVDAPCFSSAF
jgi:hypothetical protein